LFTLPESIKYLATRPERKQELLKTARKMRPDLDIPDTAEFLNPPIVDASAGSVKELFKGGLSLITPLLWLCFCTALMANFFINHWLPTLFSNFGIPNERAALITTWYHFGGTFGGLAIAILLDRFGYMIIAIMFALAVPAVAMIGFEGLPDAGMTFFASFAGFAILGAQFGNNASAGLLYPTTVRSKGVGWALSIGRFGAIVGPYAGAQLLVMGLGMQAIFMVVTIPLLVGAVAALLLSRLCYKRFNGFQLDDTPVQDSKNP
jgi:AAHS family 4-hydroxybenzoate transporter-like MFS transporter